MIDWNRRANMIAVEDVKRRLTTCLELNMPADVQHETLRHALKVIEGLEQRVPRWISVEERLPEWDEPVLILVKETEHYGLHKEHSTVYYCQYLAYWDGDEWYTAWCNGCRKISDTANEPNADDYEVTHWMPLPQPPEEDEQ